MLPEQPAEPRPAIQDVAEQSNGAVRPERAADTCPYQGLAPFEADDTELFFGRARETGALVERLGARLAGRGSILIVTGASGVGKSSLLRAGLMPALARGSLPAGGSGEWTHRLITPTATPMRTLTECLAENHSGRRMLLVVDQFEELFTLVSDERERQHFVQALYALTQEPDKAGVVLGVRADYWERCAAYPQLAEAIQDGQVIVEAMTESDLRLAITGPAAAAGLELESGLVDCILGDLRAGAEGTDRYEAGTLPLLSQSLRNTWERSEPGRMTIRGYEESGRVRDAVRRTADEVLDGLPAEQRKIALRALRRMTVITAGGRVARRRATLAEIRSAVSGGPADRAMRQDEVDALVRAFADRRLLTLHEDTVEISHDVLLTAWPALRQWIEPDLTAQEAYDRLIDDAAQWAENHRDPAFLYRGARLLAIQDTRPRWDRDPDSFPPPGPTAESFLAAATRESRRSVRRNRLVMAGLATLSALAVIAAVIAVNAAGNADRQRRLALSRQLAAQSEVEGDPATSALLAVAAWQIAPTTPARHRLLSVTAQIGRGRLIGHSAAVEAVTFSPDGSTMATGDSAGTARLWDTASRRQLGVPLKPPGCRWTVRPVFSRDGRTLITSCRNTIRTWDVETRRETGVPMENSGMIMAIAPAPDGRTVATGTSGGGIELWDTVTRARRADLVPRADQGYGRPVNAVAFTTDGRRLVSAGTDAARLWDTGTYRQIGPAFTGHTGGVNAISLSPDGTTLATAGGDGTLRLWDMVTHRETGPALQTRDGGGYANGIAFSPDGTRLVSVGNGGLTRLWDPVSHQQAGVVRTEGVVSLKAVAFSPDGRLLAVGDADGVVRLGDMVIHQQAGTAMPALSPIAVSPDGKTLAVGGPNEADPAVRLFDVRTQRRVGRPLQPARGPRTGLNAMVHALAFAPDGRTVLTANRGEIRIFAMADQRELGPPLLETPPGQKDRIGSIAFDLSGRFVAVGEGDKVLTLEVAGRRRIGSAISLADSGGSATGIAISPGGTTVAIAGEDARVRLFDVATGRQIGAPSRGLTNGFLDDLAFSPDGRTVAFTADDDTVRLLDATAGGSFEGVLIGHTSQVNTIAFSPDGRSLATGSVDRTVRLWDLATRRQIGAELTGHTKAVTGLVFVSGGKLIATVSNDETARLWNVAAPADPVTAACAIAGRSFTHAEWARLVPGEKYRKSCG